MKQNGYYVSLRQTDKISVDDNAHALPPDKGIFSEYKVSDYFCPDEWSKDGIFVPVEENQPLWIDFRGNPECAVLCSVQRINPVTGEPSDLEGGLKKDPIQNYLVLPEQLWLDGYSNQGKVYQFVATKAGEGLAVNEYVLPNHMRDSHALGFAFYAPKNPKPVAVPSNIHYYNDNTNYFTKSSMKHNKPILLNEPIWLSDTKTTTKDYGNPILSSVLRSAGVHQNASYEYTPDVIDGRIDRTVYQLEANVVENYAKASMAMGGRIEQRIKQDNNTVDYYHDKPSALLVIYMALPDQFKAIMSKGKRQDASKRDRYTHSGDFAGMPIPLIK